MKKKYKVLSALCLALIGIGLMSADAVSASKGPDKSEESCAYITTDKTDVGKTEWGETKYCTNYLYMSPGIKDNYDLYGSSEYTLEAPEGLSYDEATNTLTMENYSGKEISCNSMGEDFKVILKGENSLEMFYVWSGGYGGSLTIGGDGVLNVSGGSYFEKDALYGECGIRIFGEHGGKDDFLKITDTATVNVESDGTYNFSLISVTCTSLEDNGLVLDGVKLGGGILVKTKEEYDQPGYENGIINEYSYYIKGKSCTISADVTNKKKKGDLLSKNNIFYAVKTVGTKKKTGSVIAVGIEDEDKTGESLKIPNTVKIDGITYMVTGIAAKAFYKGSFKKLVIGENVKSIGESAFAYCGSLEEIVIKTKNLKASTVKNNAFKGTKAGLKITVPAKKLKAYEKILKARGVSLRASFIKK